MMKPRRLPDDPAYWERLAVRIEEAAWEHRGRDDMGTLDWLSQRAPWVAGVTLAAAAAFVLWAGIVQIGGSPALTSAADWTPYVAPNDELGRQISAPRPPALSGLIAGRTGGTARGEP